MESKFSMISWKPRNPMVLTNCLLLTKKGKLKPFTKPSPTIIKLLTFLTGNSNNKSESLQNKLSSTKILSPQNLLNLSVILELVWKTLIKLSINYLLIDATWTFDLLNFGKPNLVSFLFVSVNKKMSLLFTSKWTTLK